MPLDLMLVRGKGRLKGSLETSSSSHARGYSRNSTRRLLSGFEIAQNEERHEAIAPPSTAPPVLPGVDTYEPGTIAPRQSYRIYEKDYVEGVISAQVKGAMDT